MRLTFDECLAMFNTYVASLPNQYRARCELKKAMRWFVRDYYREKSKRKRRVMERESGLFPPAACCVCKTRDAERLVGHHDDYTKPLSMRWMCDSCHRLWHSAMRDWMHCKDHEKYRAKFKGVALRRLF